MKFKLEMACDNPAFYGGLPPIDRQDRHWIRMEVKLILGQVRTALFEGQHPSKDDPLILSDHNRNTVGQAYFIGQ